MALVNCDPNKGKKKNKKKKKKGKDDWSARFTFLESEGGVFDVGYGFEGHQIQVINSNLCLERVGAREIELRQCNASVERQRFLGFSPGGQGMELQPEGTFRRRGVEYERCVSQHHHPKQGERIYAEHCRKTRRTETSMWSTY